MTARTVEKKISVMCRQQKFAETDPCHAARQIPKPHYPHSLNSSKLQVTVPDYTSA
jgi:hypothetical protein